jgi:hypothetical protein
MREELLALLLVYTFTVTEQLKAHSFPTTILRLETEMDVIHPVPNCDNSQLHKRLLWRKQGTENDLLSKTLDKNHITETNGEER